MSQLRWMFSQQWAGWFLVFDRGGVTAERGYGPFVNDFECQCAADVHGVPWPPKEKPSVEG